MCDSRESFESVILKEVATLLNRDYLYRSASGEYYHAAVQGGWVIWQSRQAEVDALEAANKDLQDWFDSLKQRIADAEKQEPVATCVVYPLQGKES